MTWQSALIKILFNTFLDVLIHVKYMIPCELWSLHRGTICLYIKHGSRVVLDLQLVQGHNREG